MRALLSVSFGTSHVDTREKTIDAVENDLREEFPDRAFYSAWTSGRIIEKVAAERGEHHDTLDEAFARMIEDGVDDLIVSTMCLMKGGEMAKIINKAEEWAEAGVRAAYVADPLLAGTRDRQRVARVLSGEFAYVPEEDAVLLMGHGTKPTQKVRREVNDVYGMIQDELHAIGCDRFFVATVEGGASFDDVLPSVLESGAECVHLAPLMVVAGDHAKNDLAGDSPDSWMNRLQAEGLQTEVVLKGLGEYAGIRRLVCDHVYEALMVREVALRG